MVKITENSNGISRDNQRVKSKAVNKKTESKSAQKSSVVPKSTHSQRDTVQLSSTQITKSDENLDVKKYQDLLNKYSENKLNDLSEYGNKEKSGFYEQEEIINKTSDTILNHPGFYKNKTTDKLPVSDNLNRIRNNILTGFYNSDEVLEETAEKLIDSDITPLER